jgi:hypothetical protein
MCFDTATRASLIQLLFAGAGLMAALPDALVQQQMLRGRTGAGSAKTAIIARF